MKKVRLWILAAILILCGTVSFASCTANDDNSAEKQPTIERIQERGKLLVGTTGDYRPLSYREADGNYWGFGIEIAEKIALTPLMQRCLVFSPEKRIRMDELVIEARKGLELCKKRVRSKSDVKVEEIHPMVSSLDERWPEEMIDNTI